jgi:TusE/DsrC/DsvC family sulfur relay protein
MPLIEHNGTTIHLDDDGFLLNFEDWDEKIAGVLAEREGIGVLTEDKIDILKFLREYYKKYNFFPIVRHVCKNVHQPKNCVNEQFLNPVKAWKIAGLPNPGSEVIMFETWEPLGF